MRHWKNEHTFAAASRNFSISSWLKRPRGVYVCGFTKSQLSKDVYVAGDCEGSRKIIGLSLPIFSRGKKGLKDAFTFRNF